MPPDTGYLDRTRHVAHRRLTVAEYHRMGEAGILTDEDRVELIDGELIATAPIGSNHAGASIALNALLTSLLRGRGLVSVDLSEFLCVRRLRSHPPLGDLTVSGEGRFRQGHDAA